MKGVPQLLKEAREAAGLKQAALARLAGLPRSVLNSYERGHREPGASTFLRTLRAAGAAVTLRRVPTVAEEQRASRILMQVLELAEALPYRSRGLRFPPFRSHLR